MAFRAERMRIKKLMEPGEEIVASDLLKERRAALIVTSTAVYVLDARVVRLPFTEIVRAEWGGGGLFGDWLEIEVAAGGSARIEYDVRSRDKAKLRLAGQTVVDRAARRA